MSAPAIEAETNPRTSGLARFRRVIRLSASPAAPRAEDSPTEDCLRRAAYLTHAPDNGQTATFVASAADRADARGDVFAAAEGYLDAAALQQQEPEHGSAAARVYVRKAEALALSPALTVAERATLLRRIAALRSRDGSSRSVQP